MVSPHETVDELARLACSHVGPIAFTLDKVEVPLLIEIRFQIPGSPFINEADFEFPIDFAKAVKMNGFYSKEPTAVISNVIDAIQAFTATKLVQFRDDIQCNIVSSDWVVHDIGLVKFDFTCKAMFRCDTFTLRGSKLPFNQSINEGSPVLFDDNSIRATLETMMKFKRV